MQPLQPPVGALAGIQGEIHRHTCWYLGPLALFIITECGTAVSYLPFFLSLGDLMPGSTNPALSLDPSIGQVSFRRNILAHIFFLNIGSKTKCVLTQGAGYSETPAVDPSYEAGGPHVPTESAGMAVGVDGSQAYIYGKK